MAYERRTISGGVPATTISGTTDGSTLSIIIADATGWPSGSVGDFGIVIDRGLDTEEKCLIDSLSSTTLTVASGGRGVDGTAAVSHAAGASIEHCLLARDLDEANAHIATTALDHHTQYLNTTRHDVEARHAFGAALGTPSAAADIGTAAATGSGDDPAREDHVHKIGTGAINDAAMFAEGIIGQTAIATDAVTSAEIAADAVGTAEIAADAVTSSEIAALAVGSAELAADAVIAGKIADGAVDATATLANSIVTLAKLASEASTSYTVTLANVTLGTGGTKYGNYFKAGRIVIGVAGFNLGTGGSVTGDLTIGLPFACVAGTADWIIAGRATQPGSRASGMGVIQGGSSVGELIVTIGSDEWDATHPFTWTNGAVFRCVYLYEAAS